MNLTFREAHPETDGATIVALLNGFSIVSESCELSADIKDTLIDNLKEYGNSKIFFVEDAGAAIGIAFCVISFSSFYAKKVLNIHDFYINPKYHRKGVGDALMAYVLSEAKKDSFCKVTLEVVGDNFAAQRLYEKNGFFGNGIDTAKETKFFMTRMC